MSDGFPVLFTIGGNRHEIILVNPTLALEDLKHEIEGNLQSPNCAEVLSKYKKSEPQSVLQVKVKWAAEGRDNRLFPKETIVTEDNVQAVLKMMAVGVGKDIFDVSLK